MCFEFRIVGAIRLVRLSSLIFLFHCGNSISDEHHLAPGDERDASGLTVRSGSQDARETCPLRRESTGVRHGQTRALRRSTSQRSVLRGSSSFAGGAREDEEIPREPLLEVPMVFDGQELQ